MGGKATGGKRCTRQEAERISEDLKKAFDGCFERWEIAGSYRRGKEELGDVDLCVIPYGEFDKRLGHLFGWQGTRRKGDDPKPKKVGLVNGIQVDFYLTNHSSWGAMLMFCTGSPGMNIRQRQIAKKLGLLLNEKGVWRSGRQVAGEGEYEVYRALDMEFLPPSEREV